MPRLKAVARGTKKRFTKVRQLEREGDYQLQPPSRRRIPAPQPFTSRRERRTEPGQVDRGAYVRCENERRIATGDEIHPAGRDEETPVGKRNLLDDTVREGVHDIAAA